MTARAAAALDLGLGLMASVLLGAALVVGLGNDDLYAAIAAGALFFAGGLAAAPPRARRPVAVALRLVAAPMLLGALYCQVAHWSAGAVVFVSMVVLAATVGVGGGLLARSAIAAGRDSGWGPIGPGPVARRWQVFGAALTATAALAALIGWAVPRLTAVAIERSREHEVRYAAPPYEFTTLDGRKVSGGRLRGVTACPRPSMPTVGWPLPLTRPRCRRW